MNLLPEPPMPELESPRVQAAMRVLGILPEDLEKREIADYDGIEPRYELFENKRRTLIGQVNARVLESPEEAELQGQEEVARDRNAAFMQKVLDAERRNMRKMALMAKKDVQKIVLEEFETKLTLHNGAERMEEGAERVRNLRKARDAKLKEIQKAAQKRAVKTTEVRNRAHQRMEEEAAELTSKLNEANDRAAKKMDDIAAEREEMRLKSRERELQTGERLAKHEHHQLRHRERAYDSIVAKYENHTERLADHLGQRQSNTEAIAQRHQESMERVQNHWEAKQRDTEAKYREILERHEEAKQRREELAAKKVKEYRVENTKRKTAFDARYDRLMKDQEETSNISRRLQQSAEAYSRSLSDSQIAALQMRGHHGDLVAANRQRLLRAHQYAQEQQLSKIDQMRQRVEFMLDSKRTADQRRTVMLKNCAAEKHHLGQEIYKVKSSPAEKMVKLLQELDPEPEAAARIREIMGQLGREKSLGGVEVPETV